MKELRNKELRNNRGKLLDKFKQFFENASKKELEKLWEKNKKYNEYGPSVTDYLDEVENEKIMDMEKYAIYCTPEQTKRAIELEAPIDHSSNRFDSDCVNNIQLIDNELYAIIPTAEQMNGWLEEQGVSIEVSRLYRNNPNWSIFVDDTQIVEKYYSTKKEAIIAAIDAALDFLDKRNKK